MADSVEATFDVDVVGLTDFVDYKSDAELFDIESGEEFGLFGENNGTTLQQSSSVSNGKSEPYDHGAPSHMTSQSNINASLTKLNKKPRKNKVWNEMEKDLFLKGLELFGQNWRKISKFIATKTIMQVQVYHKEWAATANVIPDHVNIANDSSIYLPLGNHDKTCIMARESASVELTENRDCNKGEINMKFSYSNEQMNNLAERCKANSADSGISFGEGIVVSPLHDWDLGSQVSVSGTAEEPSSVVGRLTMCDRKVEKVKTNERRKLQSTRTPKKKLVNRIKDKRRLMKQSPSKAKRKNLKSSLITNNPHARASATFDEGQIVHLKKNESEESDVNIDDSDEELVEIDDRKQVKTFEKREGEVLPTLRANKNSSKYKYSSEEDYESDSLSDDEKMFYLKMYQSVEEMNIFKYTLIKDKIIHAWDRQKPLFLTKEQASVELKFHCSNLVNEIFDFLCINKFINYCTVSDTVETQNLRKDNLSKNRVLRKRNYNMSSKNMSNGKLCNDVIQKGGGVTLSHDKSGAVIDALHIPESRSRVQDSKKATALPPVKLLNLLNYDPDTPAPFTLIIYPQAIITLDLHSHSSFSEVIGLLGGFLDHGKRALHITSAVPTNSSSSGIHCEMCPVSQIEALETIRRSGKEVVGWYHSHPTFRPNPSQRDLDTQAHLQNWFKRNCSPFVGLIISSFSPSSNSESSEIRCFILDTPPSRHSRDLEGSCDVELPYKLQWTVQSESELKWEEIEMSVEDVLQKCRDQPNAVNWKIECKDGASYLDKFVASLKMLLPVSMKELVNFIKDFVIEF